MEDTRYIRYTYTKTKLVIFQDTPERKLNKAWRVVENAIEGKIGFAYGKVKKIPLASGKMIRERMEVLKKRRYSARYSDEESSHFTSELRNLRKKEKLFYRFDETAYKQLISNYSRLNNSLNLLFKEGEIVDYVVTKGGRLRVEFFKEYKKRDIIEIEQGWTYSYNSDKAGITIPKFQTLFTHYNPPFMFSGDISDYKIEVSTNNAVPHISVKEIINTYKEEQNRLLGVKEKLVYGTERAMKSEDNRFNGDWKITDDFGNVLKRYKDRGVDGTYVTSEPPALPLEHRKVKPIIWNLQSRRNKKVVPTKDNKLKLF